MLPESQVTSILCMCTHLSKFAASLIVVPNKVDLLDDIKLFSTFFDNPVIVVLVAVIWVLFALLIVWGRHRDRQDLDKVR